MKSLRNYESRALTRRLASAGASRLMTWATNGQHSGSNADTGEMSFLASLPMSLKQVIDVGSSRGMWAQLLLRTHPEASYLGVEPIEQFADEARKSLPLAWKTVSGLCLKEPDFPESTANDQIGGKAMRAALSMEGRDLSDMPSSTLDQFGLDYGFGEPDFIKIDTDGFDLTVLRSGLQLIRKSRPIIQIEAGRFYVAGNSNINELFIFGKDLDYILAVILPKSIYRVTRPSEILNYRTSFNLALVPRELH